MRASEEPYQFQQDRACPSTGVREIDVCLLKGKIRKVPLWSYSTKRVRWTQRRRPFIWRGAAWALILQRRPASQHPRVNQVPENNSRQEVPFPAASPPATVFAGEGRDDASWPEPDSGLRARFCSAPSTSFSHRGKRALKCIPNGHSEGAMPSSLGTTLVPRNCPALLCLTRDSLLRSTISATPSQGDPRVPLPSSFTSSQILAEQMMRRILHEALERPQGPESRWCLLWQFVPSAGAKEAMNKRADKRESDFTG